jgi:hypothetical protein
MPANPNNMSYISQNHKFLNPKDGHHDSHVEQLLRDEVREKDDQIISMSKQITEVV